MSPPAKLVLLLLLALFFMLLGSAVAVLLAVPLFNHDLLILYRIIENLIQDQYVKFSNHTIRISVYLSGPGAAWLFSENTFQYRELIKGI
jgi:hypothetical protein